MEALHFGQGGVPAPLLIKTPFRIFLKGSNWPQYLDQIIKMKN
jgi:hypothetical protein